MQSLKTSNGKCNKRHNPWYLLYIEFITDLFESNKSKWANEQRKYELLLGKKMFQFNINATTINFFAVSLDIIEKAKLMVSAHIYYQEDAMQISGTEVVSQTSVSVEVRETGN